MLARFALPARAVSEVVSMQWDLAQECTCTEDRTISFKATVSVSQAVSSIEQLGACMCCCWATAQFDANFQIALARARCLTWGKQLRGRNPDAEWFIADPRVCSEWPSDAAQQSQRSCSNRGLEKGLVVVTRGATVQRLAFSQGQI